MELTKEKYELWVSQGQGGSKVDEFSSLAEALEAAKKLEGQMSVGIIYPDKTWHKWD